MKYFSILASQLHEPNDIFHSSAAEREKTFANMAHGKKRSNSGSGMVVDSNNTTSNISEDYSAASSHKRPRSENGKQLKENIPSSNLPGKDKFSFFLFRLKLISLLQNDTKYKLNFIKFKRFAS